MTSELDEGGQNMHVDNFVLNGFISCGCYLKVQNSEKEQNSDVK